MEKRELAIVEAIEKNDQLVPMQPIESKEEYEEVVESMKEALLEQAFSK